MMAVEEESIRARKEAGIRLEEYAVERTVCGDYDLI